MTANPFLRQRFQAQSAGIAIVREVLKREPFLNGFTTSQLYKIVVKEPAPADFQTYPLRRPPPPPPPNKKKSYVQLAPQATYPEHPDHPIRSIRFLKEFILPFLAGAKEISMVRQPTAKTIAAQQAGDAPKPKSHLTASQVEWVWKVIPPEQRAKSPVAPKEKVVVGREVGVGLDVSHLNKRRQKARVGKVSREVNKLKAYSRFSEERDGFMERLNQDPELKVKMLDLVEGSSETGLEALLEKEKQLNKGRPRERTSIASVDTEQHLKTQTEKIRRLVAYKYHTGYGQPTSRAE